MPMLLQQNRPLEPFPARGWQLNGPVVESAQTNFRNSTNPLNHPSNRVGAR